MNSSEKCVIVSSCLGEWLLSFVGPVSMLVFLPATSDVTAVKGHPYPSFPIKPLSLSDSCLHCLKKQIEPHTEYVTRAVVHDFAYYDTIKFRDFTSKQRIESKDCTQKRASKP